VSLCVFELPFTEETNGQWYYSNVFNFKTQMDTGLDKKYEISHFSHPYFQLGPGMLWKK
jgi:hypothetical protein